MAGRFKLSSLIDKWIPKVAQAFVAGIKQITMRVKVAPIEAALRAQDIPSAIRSIDLSPENFRDLDRVIEQVFDAAGTAAAEAIPASSIIGDAAEIRFSFRDPRAAAWLRNHSMETITDILDDQREMIRQHLAAGLEADRNPRSVALDLVGRINSMTRQREGGVIGLTATQEKWARSYAEDLANGSRSALTRALRDKRFDRTVEKAIREGRPLTAAQQEKMVAAYRNRALRYRAENIGETETQTAAHEAQNESTRQAIASQNIEESQVEKIWRTSGDARVRDTHRGLSGKSVSFNESFRSSSGALLRFPGDPFAPLSERSRCRCHLDTRIRRATRGTS